MKGGTDVGTEVAQCFETGFAGQGVGRFSEQARFRAPAVIETAIPCGTLAGRHRSHTVEWAPALGYRAVKVIIDGGERPDLLGAGSFTFEDIGENHTIQIVLEPIPDEGDGTGGAGNGDDGSGGGNGSGDGSGGSPDGDGDGDESGAWKTLKNRLALAQIGDELSCLPDPSSGPLGRSRARRGSSPHPRVADLSGRTVARVRVLRPWVRAVHIPRSKTNRQGASRVRRPLPFMFAGVDFSTD